jgi:hypothetical protein
MVFTPVCSIHTVLLVYSTHLKSLLVAATVLTAACAAAGSTFPNPPPPLCSNCCCAASAAAADTRPLQPHPPEPRAHLLSPLMPATALTPAAAAAANTSSSCLCESKAPTLMMRGVEGPRADTNADVSSDTCTAQDSMSPNCSTTNLHSVGAHCNQNQAHLALVTLYGQRQCVLSDMHISTPTDVSAAHMPAVGQCRALPGPCQHWGRTGWPQRLWHLTNTTASSDESVHNLPQAAPQRH